VTKTSFSNGFYIVVNYGESVYSRNGLSVGAYDYAVMEEDA